MVLAVLVEVGREGPALCLGWLEHLLRAGAVVVVVVTLAPAPQAAQVS
jgi:hypothetical protein